MVKIQQTVSDFQTPEKGESYKIVDVKETTQQNFKGLSVSFRPIKETEETEKINYTLTLWFGQKGFVGSKSKLGAFISAFSDFYAKTEDVDVAIEKAQDSDNWVNHTIKIIELRDKDNEIKVIS